MSDYLVVDDRSKFQKWDDHIGEWYGGLAKSNKELFIFLFPLMFVVDLFLIPVRLVENKLHGRKPK